MNCPKCGHPISPNSKFCGVCGMPVAQESVAENKTQSVDEFKEQTFEARQDMTRQPYDLQNPATRIYVPEDAVSPQTTEVPPQNYDDPFSADAASYQQPANGADPDSAPRDFSAQYQQYQQPSPYGSTRNPNGSKAPQKGSKTPLIIVIIVLVVLLIGGGITAAVLIINSNKGDNDPTQSTTVKVDEDTTQPTTVNEDEDTTQPTTVVTEPSEPAFDITESSNTKMSMDDIVASLKAAQEDDTSDDTHSLDIYAEGDTVVYKYTYKDVIEDSKKDLYTEKLEEQSEKSDIKTTMINSINQIEQITGRKIHIKIVYVDKSGYVLGEHVY